MKKVSLILIGIILGFLMYGAIDLVSDEAYMPCEITDKYEHNGKQYIGIAVEITPEEYIGLDIGDEYRIRSFEE